METRRTIRERLQLGLRPRLIGLVVLTALVAGGLVGVVLIQNSRDALREHILESDLAAADLAARFAANYVEGAETNVRQFAARPLFLRAVFDHDVEQAEWHLAQFLQLDKRFDNISVYDTQGIGWASGLMSNWQYRGGSVTDREWFQQTLATKKSYLGIPLLSRGTGNAVVAYIVPIFDDQGEMRAVLGASISLAALSDAITGIGVSPSARASLMDSRQGGIILAHPDKSRILTPVSGQNAAALRALAGERGTMETRSSSSELDLAAFAPVPGLPWSVLILEPVETAYAPLNNLTVQAALYITIVMLMATVLGVLLARTITGPVRQLVRGAEEIGKGNLEYRIEVAARDEIGQLSRAFNQMTENLQAVTASRDELNREITERRRAEAAEALHREELKQSLAELGASRRAALNMMADADDARRMAEQANENLRSEVAERKRAEEELREYRDQLEELVEERTRELRETQEQLVRREKLAVLGQLAGGVGHELRNPLGAIKNAAYFLNLALESPEPDVAETIQILEHEVDNCERIISSLLDFARPRPPALRPVDLRPLIQEALAREAPPAHIQVEARFAEDLPEIVADPDQLAVVFSNLTRNAVQAMPQGGRLEVVIGLTPPGDQVTVAFRDTGVGIPPEIQAHLFEPLFTTKARGIGLGLAVSKLLVEGMGGTIAVESPSTELATGEVGQGSTFTVYLPVAKE